MKKNTIIAITIFVCLLFVSGCGTMTGYCGNMGCGHGEKDKSGESQKQKKSLEEEKKDVYACPMGHFESDKPGDCPKCGMKLEKEKLK